MFRITTHPRCLGFCHGGARHNSKFLRSCRLISCHNTWRVNWLVNSLLISCCSPHWSLFLECLLMCVCMCACACDSGWKGGQPWCAARLAVHEWCGHSPVCQRCVRAAIAMGTLLPMGLLWRETVPEQASACHTGQGSPAGHVWGTGLYTYTHIPPGKCEVKNNLCWWCLYFN